MCSGGGVNHYVSGVIASMLHENLEDEYLDKIIKIYKVISNIYVTLFLYYKCSKSISLT